MSDAYYQQRARQRTRRLLIAGGLLALFACAVAGVVSLFYDACTGGFDRTPDAVVRSYLDAVRRGDAAVAQECWDGSSKRGARPLGLTARREEPSQTTIPFSNR